jgi:Cu2+-exporting ATPase
MTSTEKDLPRSTPAASGPVACSHCTLPVPPALIEPDAQHQFCCNGCRTVFAVLHEHGLTQYYDLIQLEGAKGRRARTTGKTYEELDDPAFLQLYAKPRPDGQWSTELYLEGVHCAACIWLVERMGREVDGVVDARLDIGKQTAELTWDPAKIQLSTIARQLDALGHPAHPFRGAEARDLRRKEERALIARIGVAGAIMANVMLMALALYSGRMEPEFEAFFRWGSLVLTIPSMAWCGRVFFRGALASLRSGALHMDLPIAIGLTAGFAWGTVNTVLQRGEIWFDTVATLVFLLLIGRWVQQRQRRAANDAAELLFSLAPSTARLVREEDGEVREVPVERVKPGDVLEVRAGESIPADGVIETGESTLDTSLLTGESRPIEAGPGDPVHAGTVNLASLLRIRAEATGTATRVGRLMQAVEEASRRRAPVVALADRIVPKFVAVVLLLALATAIGWAFVDVWAGLDHAFALLIVTCPCALGLATPLAIHAAIGHAARRGILVKGGDALERLSHPAVILFDKTGTLTQGRTELLQWLGSNEAKPLVLAAERSSAHPIAQAFVAALGGAVAGEAPVATAQRVSQTTGGGVEADVDGRKVLVGSPVYVAQRLQDPQLATHPFVQELVAQALTPVLIAVDGQVTSAAGFGDPLRDDAEQSVRELQALGCEVRILSGDHPAVVAEVGRRLGLAEAACRGGATPEDKLAAVEEALKHGHVFMVGDGVNDAAALAAATVGISVHGGAEASLAAADVFLTRPGIQPVVELLRGARRAVRVVKRNILFSLGYNVVGVTLAMSGVLTPLIGSILMPFASLTVVTSSYRSRTFPKPSGTEPSVWAARRGR